MTLAQIRDRYEPVWHGASWREIPPPPQMPLERQPAALRAGLEPSEGKRAYTSRSSHLDAIRCLLVAQALTVPELMAETGLSKRSVQICLQYFRRTRVLKSVAWTGVDGFGRPYRQYRIGR